MSCHNEMSIIQNQSKQWFQHYSDREFITNNLDAINWKVTVPLITQDLITESIFFKALIDYYTCTVTWTSNPIVQTYFDNRNIYFLSSQICLKKPDLLEYYDIDDYHAFVENPGFSYGYYKNFSVLKIPLKSNLDCLSEVSIKLSYSADCKRNEKSEL